MAIPNTVQLKLRATLPSIRSVDFPSDDPESFWGPLLNRQRDRYSANSEPERRSIKALEARLRIALPRALKRELVMYFHECPTQDSKLREEKMPVDARSGSRVTTLLPLIGISVASIRYGSLDLAIEFAGVKHLVDLFDANFDVFMMFAQAYLPYAFERSLNEMDFYRDDFLFDVTPTADLISAFACHKHSPSTPTTEAQAQSQPTAVMGASPTVATMDRARAIWQLTNFTLLVPVVLSLLVLYVAAKQLSEEKGSLKDSRQELSSREQAFAKSVQGRIAQLEKSQGEMITLLRESYHGSVKKK